MSATTISNTPTTAATTAHPRSTQARSILRWAGGALILLTVVLYVIFATAAINFQARPFPGFLITYTGVVNSGQATTEDEAWTGLNAGIQRQDRILAFDDTALVDLEAANPDFASIRTAFTDTLSGYSVGQTVTITFQRLEEFGIDPSICGEVVDGAAICSVDVSLMSMPARDMLAFFIVPFVAGVIVLMLGMAVYYRRADQPDALTVSAIACLSAIYMGGLFDIGTTHTITPVWLIAASLLGGFIITFSLIFPNQLRITNWLKFNGIEPITMLPILITLGIGIALANAYLNPANAWDHTTTQLATSMSVIALGVMIMMYAWVQRPLSITAVTRDQSNTVLIGAGLMAVPALMWFINRILLDANILNFPITFEALMPLYIFPNAAFAYAVLQYRRFDTDAVLSQGISYTIMLVALIVSLYLLTFGSAIIALDILNPNSILGVGLVLFVMVFLFTPLRTNLQARIDALYYRTRRDYQRRVEKFAQKLTNQTQYKVIVDEFTQTVNQTLQPTSLFIFLYDTESEQYVVNRFNQQATDVRFKSDGALASFIPSIEGSFTIAPGQPLPYSLMTERSRLNILQARVITPMMSTETLIGFVVLGAARSGKPAYDYEELRFLTNLTGQFAIATERSQVIESLERRVNELNVLSQVGQAVNFDIDFDDQLELINAQTSRLINAPCFYIALHEESTKQLYFAFFLEDDERYDDRENIRWSIDEGVFGDIVKTGRAMHLDNYAGEMRSRGVEISLVSSDLRAFMGVPLSTNRGTLGVMAIAKKAGTPYTDEQFKIFGDIAALAATSLDKSRLFEETKIRERQLTVLNEISQQLVATEFNVEKLLSLIMKSAVDILNAEAGSLLLTTEDSSRDLEFRVVIGGAGDELVGTRISATTGVAGQVARTGESVIVNDLSRDPRHDSKIGEGSEFKPTTLLAVPLIAKNENIGVLEVMNKVDGTVFVDSDRELLTTFASQAAIAIENARTFSMTEEQLANRVRELEALERIDRELNRTLDLNEVGKATVRSAMQMLKAQAGLLAMVRKRDGETRLEVIAIEGYEESDYPEGADGIIWPADKGVIGRVMRNRQPDLVTDPNIDPDYDTGLHGSISQITIPMMTGREITAVLVLETNQPPAFTLGDWGFAQRIAEHASIAIANAEFYAALQLANKSKSEFMGFVAHELKNPLASVKGWADVLRSGMSGDLTEQQANFVNIIHSNSNRMQTIINDLKAAAEIDANEFKVDPQPIYIRNAVIETLRPFMHTLDEKNQSLINNVPDDMPMIMGDEGRLIQVLTNLISNAHKYSPPDTAITIAGEVMEQYIDSKGRNLGRMVRIAVIDEGFGMSEEDQKRLFKERYFRSTNKLALDQPGTGLGMVLTYEIIRKHNGDIWVESKLGEGSTFSIVIPIATDEQIEQFMNHEAEPSGD